jgi:DNA-binding GntR family transcriptional regulator
MRLFFHKATMDADFYRHYLPDNEAICAALESGKLDQAATLLLAYLDRSEDNLSDVHGADAG